jgi:hypothetical protein
MYPRTDQLSIIASDTYSRDAVSNCSEITAYCDIPPSLQVNTEITVKQDTVTSFSISHSDLMQNHHKFLDDKQSDT